LLLWKSYIVVILDIIVRF